MRKYFHGVHEPEVTNLIKSIVRKEWVVMDIGADVGYHSLLLGRHARTVFAVEPVVKNFVVLCGNIARNGLTNVYPIRAAASDTTSMQQFYYSHNTGVGSMMHARYDGEWNEVYAVALDDIVPVKIDFFKMDLR